MPRHSVDQKYFEDLEIGSVYPIPSRTITDAHFLLFSALSGDFHPLHLNQQYVEEETEFEGRVAHGALNSVFTVVGASALSRYVEETAVAFLSQSSEFLAPVIVGDTVYPELEITDKRPGESTGVVVLESRMYNQDDEQVLQGELELLVESRESEP